MKKIFTGIDSFVKREWFLLIVVTVICVAVALFEVL